MSQRNRDKDDTDDSKEVLPLAARVQTLLEAVQLSIQGGLNSNSLFVLARALKAYEITTGTRLTPEILQAAFNLWWNTVRSMLPREADFDEYLFDFLDRFAKTRTPLGANPLEEALRRAQSEPPPSEAATYTSTKIRLLITVCYHLQILVGDAPFFLSVRDAARIINTKPPHPAQALLAGLERAGILIEIAKGTPAGRKATRFRYKPSQPPPTGT